MNDIVVINGSPKTDSDSLKYVEKLLDQLKQSNYQFTYKIHQLSKMNIVNCTGCMNCTRNGKCRVDDDIIKIKEDIKESSIVIFSSPVHFNQVSSYFQNFIERSLIDLHLFTYLGKYFGTVISTNGSGEDDVDKYLSKIGYLFGMKKIGTTFISRSDGTNKQKEKKFIQNIGQVLSGKKIKPSLINTLYFESMKSIIKGNPEYFKYENQYWNEQHWFSKSYKQIEQGLSLHI